MEWFNFNNIQFKSFFIIMMLAFLFIVFLILTYVLSGRRDQKYGKRIKAESTTLRIYNIDVKNNKVTYFNRSDLKGKKEIDMTTFYSHFHINDVDKIKSWVYSICTDYKNADNYLEADVVLNHGRSTYFSLLKLQKYDPNEGIIHLESFILKYITPNNSTNKKKKKSTYCCY